MAPVYTELMRDNKTILLNITGVEIEEIFALLRQEKSHHLLEFLAVLCECDGAPMNQYQDLIIEQLARPENAAIFYLTGLGANKQRQPTPVISVDGGRNFMPLAHFAQSAFDDNDGDDDPAYTYLETQFDLFGKLCAGRNANAIDFVAKRLKWDEVFFCVQELPEDTPKERRAECDIPKSLRAKCVPTLTRFPTAFSSLFHLIFSRYVALIVNLYVDVGKNRDIFSNVQLTYPLDEQQDEPDTSNSVGNKGIGVSLTGATLEHFGALAAFIKKTVEGTDDMVASCRQHNVFISEVLRLLKDLVRFGYYTDPVIIKELVEPLIKLADGFGDAQSMGADGKVAPVNDEWRKEGRYAQNGNNDLLAALKSAVIDVLNTIYNYQASARLRQFIDDFKSLYDRRNDAPVIKRRFSRRSWAGRKSEGLPAAHAAALKALMKDGLTDAELFECTDAVRDYVGALIKGADCVTPDVDLQVRTL